MVMIKFLYLSLAGFFPYRGIQICTFPLFLQDPLKQINAPFSVSLVVTDLWPVAVISFKFHDSLLHNGKLYHQHFLCEVSLQKTPLLSNDISKPLQCFESQAQLILNVHHARLALGSAALRHSWSVFFKLLAEWITIRGPGTVTVVVSILLLLFWLKSNLFLMSLSRSLLHQIDLLNSK